MGGDANVAWQDKPITPAPEALARWRRVGLKAAGPCPRCTDDVNADIYVGNTAVISMAGANEDAFDVPNTFRCNCDETHRGRPRGREGCGARWYARVQFAGSGSTTFTPEDDAAVQQATEIVAAAVHDSRSGVRAAAEKWIPGIAAISGLFGLASIVTAKDSIDALTLTTRVVAFVLIGASVILAAVASVLGYAAAFGWPTTLTLNSPDAVRRAADWIAASTQRTARRLRFAVAAGVVSLLLLLTALGLIWVHPREPDRVTVTVGPDGREQTACGELVSVQDWMLTLKITDGNTTREVPYRLSDITGLALSSHCGG
jgi:hypothetical protein